MIKYALSLALASFVCLSQGESSTSAQQAPCLHHAQDTQLGDVNHTPLRNLSSFAVLPIFSVQDPSYSTLYNPSYTIIKNELGKMGSIKEVPLTYVKGMAFASAFLVVNVQKVPTLESKSPDLTKVSLIVESMATIEKSGVECLLPIWTRSVFTEDGSASSIESAIGKLMMQFDHCFTACNGKDCSKPTFYLYQP